jgi:hypothetical protein
MCALIALGYVARLRIAEGLRAPVATTPGCVADAVPATRIKAGAGVRPAPAPARSLTLAISP